MNILEIKNIEKSFGENKVLRDISLSVKDGEIVSVIGPSGSGKSTLLRCACMLETMDRGSVVYEGEPAVWNEGDGRVQYADKKRLRELRALYGLVFQNFNLFPHYSVLRNVMDAPIHVQKRGRDEVKGRPWLFWKRWDSQTRRTCIPASCPEASSRGWPSPGLWP